MSRWIDILHVATPGFGMMPRQQRIAVVEAIATRHGVTLEAVLGPARGKEVVAARWEAMRAIHNQFGDSTPRIGRLFNRDHSTVLHALKVTKNLGDNCLLDLIKSGKNKRTGTALATPPGPKQPVCVGDENA